MEFKVCLQYFIYHCRKFFGYFHLLFPSIIWKKINSSWLVLQFCRNQLIICFEWFHFFAVNPPFTLRKKSPYSELFWSAFSVDFPVFSPNVGKSGKNADQNNSEYGFLLRRVYLHENRTKNLSRTCIPVFWIYALMFLKDQRFSRKNNWYVTFLKANNLTYSRANFMFLVKFLAGCRLEVGQFCLHGPENETQKSHWQ